MFLIKTAVVQLPNLRLCFSSQCSVSTCSG